MTSMVAWSTAAADCSITSVHESHVAYDDSFMSFAMLGCTGSGGLTPQIWMMARFPQAAAGQFGVMIDRVTLLARGWYANSIMPVGAGPGMRFDLYYSDDHNTSSVPLEAVVATCGYDVALAQSVCSYSFTPSLALGSVSFAPTVTLYTTYESTGITVDCLAFVRWHYIPLCG